GIPRGVLFRGPTMKTAVPLVDEGFDPQLSSDTFPAHWKNPTAPPRGEYHVPREVLPPTLRTAEAPPAREPVAPAGVKGWSTPPGYELLGEIARGGMALVYKAVDLRRQRVVAIKVSDPSLAGDGEIVARFRQEQLLAVRLAHPNLVAAYDAGQVAG